MSVLIDTSFFLASFYRRDRNHEVARQASIGNLSEVLVVAPVIWETFYMVNVRISYQRAIQALNYIRDFAKVDLTETDMVRMEEIMTQYQDAALDFVDVAQMAVTERLDIRQIYTFDQRDFRLFRPRHCEYLDLLP